MFGIFTKKKNFDLSWLKVDMHSHLLPGVDDGCKDTAVSLECMQGLQELGLDKFYVTPHIYSEVHPNNPQQLREAEKRWREEALADPQAVNFPKGLPVKLAAEYMIDDQFVKAYMDHPPLTLPDNHLLVEMSYIYERKDFQEQLFHLQIHELKPILAHPERYTFYHATPQVFARMRKRGCALQLNLLSLAGYYGDGVRKVALQLAREGLIDYIGTDLHHIRHLRAIQTFVRENDVQKILAKCPIKNQEFLGF